MHCLQGEKQKELPGLHCEQSGDVQKEIQSQPKRNKETVQDQQISKHQQLCEWKHRLCNNKDISTYMPTKLHQ